MAAEQFASLLWKHSMSNRNLKDEQGRTRANSVAKRPYSSIIDFRSYSN